MVIIADTREQRPYRFVGLPVVFATLHTGDYSIKGFEDRVSIERKEYGDFLNCVGREHKRFSAEMARILKFEFKVLIIEAEVRAIAEGQHPKSKVDPSAAIGMITRLSVQGIPVLCCADRALGESMTLRFLKRVYLTLRGIK
jgi:ERCC4-type nuclease